MAVGRDACTNEIGLEKAGVITNPKWVENLNILILLLSVLKPKFTIANV